MQRRENPVYRAEAGRLWLILLCLQICVGELQLTPLRSKDFSVMLIDTFRGQYPCLPQNVSGLRRVLTFDLELYNDESRPVRQRDVQLYYEIFSRSGELQLQGSLEVPCLRDSRCHGAMRFYTCDDSGLSGDCVYRRSRGAECHWIDISALPVRDYRVAMSLSPLENVTLLDFEPVALVDLRTLDSLKSNKLYRFALLLSVLTLLNSLLVLEPPVRAYVAKRSER